MFNKLMTINYDNNVNNNLISVIKLKYFIKININKYPDKTKTPKNNFL